MEKYIMPKSVSQYTEAKKENGVLWRSLKRIGDRRWAEVAQCSQAIGVRWCPQCGRSHVSSSWCCRHRLCPVCAIRKSRKTGHQAIEAFKYMRERGELEGCSLYLVTLTQKNVPIADIGNEVAGLLAALTSLRHSRDIRRSLIGSARNIEITYNKAARTFHPHVHMIAILRGSAPEEMASSAFWRDLWRRLMGLDYEPICDVRPITDTEGAVCEVSKYVIKAGSILGLNLPQKHLDDVISALNSALIGRRLVSYTGIWRAARAALKQLEPDQTDLEHDDDRDICGCDAGIMEAVLRWDGLEYRPVKPDEVL